MRYDIFLLPFILLLLLFTIQFTYAQRYAGVKQTMEIKGTVLDSVNRSPIEMATISMLVNGVVIKSTATDHLGRFQLSAIVGTVYKIAVSYMGYENHLSGLLSRSQNVTILLQNKSASLKELVVTVRKVVMQNKGDKLVYNAAADISNKAGSAADVLRKVPLLTVGSDGEVKMRGSSSLKVLLNGMPSGVMAKNLKEALKMIPASSIQSVEVITSPSAKYEAEGAAGVINIITRKSIKGTNGNIDIAGGNLEQSVNGSLNIAREKFDYNFNLSGYHNMQRNVSTLNRTSIRDLQPDGELLQQNDATQNDWGRSGGFGFAYRPDSTQKIGVDVSYWNGSWPSKSVLYNRYSEGATASEYNQRNEQTGKFQYYELALNYQKKFRKKNQELQLRGLIARSNDHSGYTTNQFDLAGFNYFTEKGPNKGKTWDADIQADYTHPLNSSGMSIFETGLRFTRANSNTAYEVFNNQANPGSSVLNEIASRSNAMDYFRNIYAAYASLKIETDNRWTFRPGIRFEGTRLGSSFKSNTPSFNTTFSNWVPSLLISKKMNANHELRLNYTQRIRRPWIWDLNPYVNASDPRNLTSGNPQLRPETTRMLELGHNLNAESGFTLNSAIYFSSNSDAVESLTTVNAQGISRTTPSNVASTKRLGSNVYGSLQINDKWMATGGLELYRVWFKSVALNIGNQGDFYSVNVMTSYTLPKNYTLQLSGDFSNGFVMLQGRNSAYWTYRFSVQKEFFDKKASVLLSLSNLFQQTLAQRSYATASTFRSTTLNNIYNRALSLSFSWKFGSIKNQDAEDKKFNDSGAEGARRKGKF